MGSSSSKEEQQQQQQLQVESEQGSEKVEYGGVYGPLLRDIKSGGGNESMTILGSADEVMSEMMDYEKSANSKVKRELVQNIVDSIKDMNLIKDLDTSNPNDALKQILNSLPNSKNKKMIANIPDQQKTVCKMIAKNFNKNYGDVIDVNAEPAQICQQASELIESLTVGMRNEFLMVVNDVKKILKNLLFLKDRLNEIMTPLVKQINSSTDESLKVRAIKYSDLYNMLSVEMQRQIQLLQNIMNITINPSEVNLNLLLKEYKDLPGVIEKLGGNPGTKKFGQVIAKVLMGTGITASYALIVQDALKNVGMTLSEYANGENLRALNDKLKDTIVNKDLDDKELKKFLRSYALLVGNFGHRKELKKIIEGGNCGCSKFEYIGQEKEGGSDDVMTNLDERIKQRQVVKKIVMSAFNRQLIDVFESFIISLSKLADKIGSTIPLSDILLKFKENLEALDPIIVRKNAYLELSGYYNDAESKERRDTFIAQLKNIIGVLDTIMAASIYANYKDQFGDVKSIIESLIALIDNYGDKIAEKFGGADEQSPAIKNPAVWKSTIGLSNTIKKFNYYYNVANIKENLKESAKEIEHYGKNYQKIRGISIAHEIDSINKNKTELLKKLKNREGFISTSPSNEIDKDKAEKEEEAIKAFIESQSNSKVNFWRTVEAIDEYMMVFTDGLVKNPGDVKDIKSMLDEIDVIHDWYSNASGKELHKLFDMFPADFILNGSVDSRKQVDSKWIDNDNHYYEVINKLKNINNINDKLPGNPFITMELKDDIKDSDVGFKGKKDLKKILNGVTVLKNIINIFIFIGNQFGGETLYKKVFMTPTQIYKNLCDYLSASAFNMGLDAPSFAYAFKETGDQAGQTFESRNGVKFETKNENITNAYKYVKKYYENYLKKNNDPKSKEAIKYYDNNIRPNVVNAGGAYTFINNVERHIQYFVNHLIDNSYREKYIMFDLENNVIGGKDFSDIKSKVYQGYIVVGSTNGKNTDVLKQTKDIITFLQNFTVYMRGIDSGLNGNSEFKQLDEMFVHVIKSICAKILTVIGTYDVFERPNEVQTFSPVRMILGGNDNSPKIEEEATELYLRLPLLAEFYRDLFNWYDEDFINEYKSNYKVKNDNKMAEKISLIPEFEGLFSGLIRIIFKRIRTVDISNYSDSDVQAIIEEINKIYLAVLQRSSKETVIMTVIREFINEINRRYGIVRKKERDQYNLEFSGHYDYNSIDRTENIERNFMILPGEEEAEYDILKNPPSRQYQLYLEENLLTQGENKYKIKDDHYRLFYEFRCRLDGLFRENYKQMEVKKISLGGSIKSAYNQLLKEENNEQKFKIVSKLMRGNNLYGKPDYYKYLLFHETVITGLSSLGSIYSILSRFQLLGVCLQDEDFLKSHPIPAVGARNQHIVDFVKKYYNKDIDAVYHIIENTIHPSIFEATVAGQYDFSSFKALTVIFENIFNLSNDLQGLVIVSFEENNKVPILRMNFSGLKDLIKKTFNDIKYFMDVLRPHIDKKLFNKYSNKKIIGSYYWLYEQINEKIIEGRSYNKSQTSLYFNLEEIVRHFNKAIDIAIKKIIAANKSEVFELTSYYIPNTDGSSYDSTGTFISKPVDFNDTKGLEKLIAKNLGTYKIIDPKYTGRFKHLYSWDNEDFNYNRSILYSFNQLLAKYIGMFFDKTVDKMYIKLIDKFANGTFNQSVMDQSKTFSDMEQVNIKISEFPSNKITEGVYKSINLGKIISNTDKKELNNFVNQLNNNGLANNIIDAQLKEFKRLISKYKLENTLVDITAVPNVYFKDINNLADLNKYYKEIIEVLRSIIRLNRNVIDDSEIERKNREKTNIYKSIDANVNNFITVKMTDVITGANGINQFDPQDVKYVLFTSLSLTLKNILTSKSETSQNNIYTVDNINEISHFMKESYRANLPIFLNLFKTLMNKCEYYKNLVNIVYPIDKDKILSVLTQISSGCVALISTIEEVLRELNDDPKYLEISQNSIQEYISLHNKIPLTPLSTIGIIDRRYITGLNLYNNNEKIDEFQAFLPLYSPGTTRFKFNYGFRGIFGDHKNKVLLDHMPGVLEILNNFNNSVASNEMVDKNQFKSLVEDLIKVNRYILDIKHYKGNLTHFIMNDAINFANQQYFASQNIVGYNTEGTIGRQLFYVPQIINETTNKVFDTKSYDPNNAHFIKRLYQIRADFIDSVSLTESSFKDNSIETIVKHIFENTINTNKNLTIINIVDLNVVPINVHALMRDIPLVNLYNYSYTFDRMLIELFYGLNNEFGNKMMKHLCDNSLNYPGMQSMSGLIVNWFHGTNNDGSVIGKNYIDTKLNNFNGPLQELFLMDNIKNATYYMNNHIESIADGDYYKIISEFKSISEEKKKTIIESTLKEIANYSLTIKKEKIIMNDIYDYIINIFNNLKEHLKVLFARDINGNFKDIYNSLANNKIIYEKITNLMNIFLFNLYMKTKNNLIYDDVKKIILSAILILVNYGYKKGIKITKININSILANYNSYEVINNSVNNNSNFIKSQLLNFELHILNEIESLLQLYKLINIDSKVNFLLYHSFKTLSDIITDINALCTINTNNWNSIADLIDDSIHTMFNNYKDKINAFSTLIKEYINTETVEMTDTQKQNTLVPLTIIKQLQNYYDEFKAAKEVKNIEKYINDLVKYKENINNRSFRNNIIANLKKHDKNDKNILHNVFLDTSKKVIDEYKTIINNGLSGNNPQLFMNSLITKNKFTDIGNSINRTLTSSLIKSTREMFVAMLINPYRKIWTKQEYQFIDAIFRGTGNLPLDRPKFLSDQIHDKLMFRSSTELVDSDVINSKWAAQASAERGPLSTHGNLQYYKPEESATSLFYIDRTDDTDDVEFNPKKIKEIYIEKDYKSILAFIGKMRFNTIIVRNLFFLVNLYRSLRLKLRRDLTYDRNIIVKSHAVIRPDNTEFILNQTKKDYNIEEL